MEDDMVQLVSSGGGEAYTCSVSRRKLQEKSDYFQGLFSSGMREASENCITLSALSGDVLELVEQFLADGTVKFTMDKMEEILSAGVYLQMPDLIGQCCNFLSGEMKAENVKTILGLAEELSLEFLKRSADDYVLNHIKEFSDTEDFRNLDIEEIVALLDNDELFVQEEVEVFDIGLKWLEMNKCRSSGVWEKVLDTVRFSLMESSTLRECIRQLGDRGQAHLCKPFLHEVDSYLTACHKRKQYARYLHCIKTRKTRARCEVECLIACGGFTGSECATNKCQILHMDSVSLGSDNVTMKDLNFQTLKECRLPSKLCEHCTCVVDNILYIVGGQSQYCQDGRYTLNAVYRFDPRHATWTEVSSMGTPRSLFYLGVLGGAMYAVSGWRAPNTVTRTVERYIPSEDRWEYLANLEIGLHEHAGCIHGGTIYVSGGYKGPFRGHLNQMFSYDNALQSWLERAPMLHARSYHVMVSLGGKIFIAGGVNYIGDDSFEDVLECESYDAVSNQWTEVTRLPLYASCMPCFLHHEVLMLFGGHSFAQSADHTSVQMYHGATGTWKIVNMSSNRILCFTVEKIKIPRKFIKLLK